MPAEEDNKTGRRYGYEAEKKKKKAGEKKKSN